VATRRGVGSRTAKMNTSAKKLTQVYQQKIRQHLPCTGRFPKPANKSRSTMADIQTYTSNDTISVNHIYIINRCRRIYPITSTT
jgi:hypothetical protein